LAKILSKLVKHITNINSTLRSIKSYIIVDFIHNNHRELIITTNNVISVLDLNTIKKYIKSVDSIQLENVLSPHLPQSKFYLKILSIPYYDSILKISINLNSIEQVIQSTYIFNNICVKNKGSGLNIFDFLFSFLFSFRFIFLYLIFRTRVRVRVTRSHCHTADHIR